MTIRVYQEVEVDVEFTYFKAYRGYRDSLGVPEEPDEPAHYEIDSITDLEGNEINFDDIEGGTDQVEENLVGEED
jgi:hypothetical protein